MQRKDWGPSPSSGVRRRGAVKTPVNKYLDGPAIGWLQRLVVCVSFKAGAAAQGAPEAQGAVERRADIAVFRAIGMERTQLTKMLVAEGLATAALGILFGLPLGIGLGKVFADATHTLGIAVPYVPAWGPLLGCSGAALLTAALSAWIPARRAGRVSASEALRH